MQSATLKKSTETIYEIRAPLATFDTIDFDDFDLGNGYSSHSLKAPSPEKCVSELCESLKKENSEENQNSIEEEEFSCPSNEAESEDEPNTPTTTTTTTTEKVFEDDFNNVLTSNPDHQVENIQKESTEDIKDVAEKLKPDTQNDSDIDREASDMNESGNITPTETSTGSKEANSSENNASAEEIQNNLKQKGRKHKEKASNVEYRQIDSFSDVSDQEKESPVPTVKKKTPHKELDSDSDSSDSDSGYIKRGYIPASKRAFIKDNNIQEINKTFNIIGDFVDSDFSPYTSPKPRRATVPPPLSKEESAIKSKKKAYEKRLQRLQVTTNPIERPRSTTPINIYGLEEYVNISSPEKSPHPTGHFQKLKITLPLEESCKGKSPRRSAKLSGHRSSESGEPHVFSFSEDLLFTHTKAAIILEDDVSKGFSPKRVLVPPTLSPKASPRHLNSKEKAVKTSATYMVDPWEINKNVETHSKKQLNECNIGTAETENWAVFGSNKELSKDESSDSNNAPATTPDHSAEADNELTESNSVVDALSIDPSYFPSEEILTVHIDDEGDSRTCDIRCEQVETNMHEYCDMPKISSVLSKEVENSNSVMRNDRSFKSAELGIDTADELGSPVDPVPDLGTPV